MKAGWKTAVHLQGVVNKKKNTLECSYLGNLSMVDGTAFRGEVKQKNVAYFIFLAQTNRIKNNISES